MQENMTRERFLNLPFAEYDKTREVRLVLAPLVEKLHAEATRLGFPLLVVVAHKQSVDGSSELRAATNFTGPEETPAEMVAAGRVLRGETYEAIEIATTDAARCRRQRERTTPNGILEA